MSTRLNQSISNPHTFMNFTHHATFRRINPCPVTSNMSRRSVHPVLSFLPIITNAIRTPVGTSRISKYFSYFPTAIPGQKYTCVSLSYAHRSEFLESPSSFDFLNCQRFRYAFIKSIPKWYGSLVLNLPIPLIVIDIGT